MPKRRPPPEPKVWARHVGFEWRLTMLDGEVLTPVRAVDRAEAERLAATLPVFVISYGSPVRVLTGDAPAIRSELERIDPEQHLETNTAWLFRGPAGTKAMVLEHHH